MAEAPASRRASTSDFSLTRPPAITGQETSRQIFFTMPGNGTGQYFHHVGTDMAELLFDALKAMESSRKKRMTVYMESSLAAESGGPWWR